MTSDRHHLRLDDCPHALRLLAGLLAHRTTRALEIGYEPTEYGAWVDWDALEHSWLSSTERAAVVVAHGVAMAEHHGGWAPELHRVLVDAVSRTGQLV
jgi:hypothetical protein